MIDVDLSKLFKRLSATSMASLDAAKQLCYTRTNYNIELEHWLNRLLEQPACDLSRILDACQVDTNAIHTDITLALDKLRRGNAKSPAISQDLLQAIKDAWSIASIEYSSGKIRSGHLLMAMLGNDNVRRSLLLMSRQFDKINLQLLMKTYSEICADSVEAEEATGAAEDLPSSAGKVSIPRSTSTPSLDQFTIDLTARARAGHIDAVIGRDEEIRQIIDILMRRRQNNPILTGEAGVGKTAVAEGLALRIVAGDVPEPLRDVSLRSLDLGLLQAGAGIKGEFENRLKTVIEEVKCSAKPIILFIDEAHTLIGAGGTAGQGDAANLLKPALARGELRSLAATTWAEYKKYFEKDPALARRFQVVKVEEPAEATAIAMVRALTHTLEKHHRVTLLDEAIVDAVKLSSRYISGRHLPDKAISLIDTSCARIRLSQSTTPPAIEYLIRQRDQASLSKEILEREVRIGMDHNEKLESLVASIDSLSDKLAKLNNQWEQEKQLVSRIQELATQLQGDRKDDDKEFPTTDIDQKTIEFARLRKQLKDLQGESPLVHPFVDEQAIAETVSSWTGIPVGRMVSDEIRTVLNLKSSLETQIVGQSHALERISQSIQTSRAGLNDPRVPIGVFLLAGTSGVGKTETAISLAQLLFGGEQNMTVINMSEFKEEHKVSLLMGAPPGYVGYGEGGVLTEAVRRKPYSVILLDEMEKAHPGVQDVFYQVFDKGNMKDGEGRDIDFKNTIILMTTNAGTDVIKSLCSDPDTTPEPDDFVSAIFPELLKTFKPAFLGRLTIIPYYPLRPEVIRSIAKLKLKKIAERLHEHHGATFSYDDAVLDSITQRCSEVDTGARNIDHILTKSLLPSLSIELLARAAQGDSIDSVHVGLTGQHEFTYQF